MPGPGLSVLASKIIALGKNMTREFIDNYKQQPLGERFFLEKIMLPTRPGVAKTDSVGWFGASPNLEMWEDGSEIPLANMEDFTGQIVHKAFGIGIPYNRDDVIYERSQSLLEMVRDTANKLDVLDARVLKQFADDSVDNSLYPTVPNAFDGAAMFSTTDGNGADRFGYSGGNVETGAYLDTPAEFLNGLIAVQNRAASFLDTDGQPKWSGDQLMEMVLVIPRAYADNPFKALNQPITAADSGNAGVSNFIMNMGIKIWPYVSPRYTSKQVYCFFPRVKRCFGRSDVLAPQIYESTMQSGSDVALATKQQRWQVDLLAGHYMNLPFGAVAMVDG